MTDQPGPASQPDISTIPVVLKAQKIRIAIPGGAVQFEIRMDAALVDGTGG